MARFTLDDVALEMVLAGYGRLYIERLGGNVYGLTAYDGDTITVNGGQLSADTDVESATVLVCRDGAALVSAEVWSAREVPQLVAMAERRA